jgi:hypothetical protein
MTRITLRLPDRLHEDLQLLARRMGISLNEAIVATLHTSLVSREASNSEPDLVYERQAIEIALHGLLAELDLSGPSTEQDPNATHILREENIPLLTPPLSSTILEERSDRM